MATELVGYLRHNTFLLSDARKVQGGSVRLKGGVTTNWPTTGGKVMPAGAVVVKKTADGLYYLANDAVNGDRNAAASVESLEKPDSDWQSKTITWTVTYPDGKVFGDTVALGATDDSIAEVVAALNGNAAFAAHLVASDAGASDLLVITTVVKGNVHLHVTSDLASAFGAGGQEGVGSEADYRVVYEQRDLVGLNGAARDSDLTPTLLAGHFDESKLVGLTSEARAVLESRGSIFG